MLIKNKNVFKIFTLINICFFTVFFCNFTLANTSEYKDSSLISNTNLNNNITDTKPLEEMTMFDVIKGEKVTPELRGRVVSFINQSHYEIDKYRTTIDTHYRQVENKFSDLRREINDVYNFKDDMEANLNLAKWMIISLSVGIVCLTGIVLVMWRSVVNVNRNDVEVLFSTEKVKKEVRMLDKRLELLEAMYKNNGK